MLHKRLTTPSEELFWGPFRLGKAGVPITVLALIYSFVGWLFSFWPANVPVTVESWNWSVVVYFGSILVAVGWWGIRGMKVYTGPRREVEGWVK